MRLYIAASSASALRGSGWGYFPGRHAMDFLPAEVLLARSRARAFDEKVESLIVDSHDGANRIQDPHWCKGGQS
jgi:hypothetical protein